VRGLRVVRIVVRDFIGPGLDSALDGERASSGSKVLAQGTESSTRVLVLALVGPLLSLDGGGIAPCYRASAVLRADRVVGFQVRLNVGIRGSAAIGAAAPAAAPAAAVAVAAVAVAVAVAAIAVTIALCRLSSLRSGTSSRSLLLGGRGLGLCRGRGSSGFGGGGGGC